MRRGSVVVAVGCCVLAFCSAGAGLWVNQLNAAQRPEQHGSAMPTRPTAASADTFAPVDLAVTGQVLIEVDQPADDNEPRFEPIAIPTPTAGFAGLALLGILLARRRGTNADTRAL